MTALPLPAQPQAVAEPVARPHARLFQITATVGLLPATWGLLMAVLTGWFLIPVLPTYLFGCFLLRGYWAYLAGKPHRLTPRWLWTWTALFNGLPGAAALALAVAGGFDEGLLLCAVWWLGHAGVALDARRREPVA